MSIWLLADLFPNAGRQRLIALGEQGFGQVPNYVKYNAIMAGILLMPFFVVLTANGVAKLRAMGTILSSACDATYGGRLRYLPRARQATKRPAIFKQCWGHMPWYTATHSKQVWQCSEANRVSLPKLLMRSL
jgi:hypothetical protein